MTLPGEPFGFVLVYEGVDGAGNDYPRVFGREHRPCGFSRLRERPIGFVLVYEADHVIAALYVDPAGVYANLPDVEVWDEVRDARLYDGPWPVVAHPPCARWSRLAGFTEHRFGLRRGADGGCFGSALAAVRWFGGVLEHPAYSAAWDAYRLPKPTWRGGWTAGICGGWTAYVEQGRYGLPAKKATWLYAHGVELPELRWGYTPDGEGVEPNGEFGGMDNWRKRVSYTEGSATPNAFRDELIAMARSAAEAETGRSGSNQRTKVRHVQCSRCGAMTWVTGNKAPILPHAPDCPLGRSDSYQRTNPASEERPG